LGYGSDLNSQVATARTLDRLAPLMGLEVDELASAAVQSPSLLQLSSVDVIQAILLLQCVRPRAFPAFQV